MRALYIIGVNAGLDKQYDPKPTTTSKVANKEFKKPIRTEGITIGRLDEINRVVAGDSVKVYGEVKVKVNYC